jgi:hypothetical protein
MTTQVKMSDDFGFDEPLLEIEDQDDLILDSEPEHPIVEEDSIVQKGLAFAQHYLVSSATLLATAKLEPDWLVPNAIPAGGVTFLVGRPGAMKSWLAYDLTVAVTQQRPWLRFGAPRTIGSPSALILNFDNPGSECARRFLRLGLRPTDAAMFHSLGAHRPPEGLPAILQLPHGFTPLEAMVAAYKPDLIVVDSLRQAHLSDESSSQEMAVVMSQLRQLSGFGGAVVVVHHTRKNDGAMRGSTEIEAAADAIIDVDDHVATWRKTRGWELKDASVTFMLEDEGDLTFLRGGTTLTDVLTAGPADGMTTKQIEQALGISTSVAKATLEKAEARGLVVLMRNEEGARAWRLAG